MLPELGVDSGEILHGISLGRLGEPRKRLFGPRAGGLPVLSRMDISGISGGLGHVEPLPPPLGRADIEKVAGSRPRRAQNPPIKMMGHRTKGGWGGGVTPIWYTPANFSSVSNLPQALTINGITEMPSFRYEGKDATTLTWPAVVGPTLNVFGTGSDIEVGLETPLIDSADKAVRFNSGKFFRTDVAESACEIDLEDFVVEMFVKLGPAAPTHFGTTNAGGTALGWRMNGVTTGSQSAIHIGSGAATASTNATTASVSVECWSHVIAMVDRNENSNNGMRIYVNGLVGNSTNPSALNVSLTTGNRFTVGTSVDNTAPSRCSAQTLEIVYMAMYKRSGWFAGGATNATQWSDVARERCSRIAGLYPEIPYGTAVPTTKSRTTSAFLDKVSDSGVRQMWLMGTGWPRICRRRDSGGTARAGLLMEYSATNLYGRAWSIDHTDWTKSNLVGPTTSDRSTDTPWRVALALSGNNPYPASWSIIPDATLGTHYVTYAFPPTLTATTYIASVFAKAQDLDWLQIYNATIGVGATFDVANGVVGTTTGSCTPGIENWGNGWYRCWIVFTGTAVAHTVQFHAAQDTGNTAYSGDGTTAAALWWGFQLEAHGSWYAGVGPTSPVLTQSVSATRVQDRLDYTLGNITVPTALQANVLGNPLVIDGGSSGSKPLGLSATLAGSFQVNGISMFVDPTGQEGINWVYSSSVQRAKVVGTTDLYNGAQHTVVCNDNTDNVRLKVDNVEEGTPDTSATMPTLTPAYLQVGCDQGGVFYQTAHCLIYELRIWSTFL